MNTKVPPDNKLYGQTCIHLEDKTFGDVESVGHHDIGIYIIGQCNKYHKPCSILIPDNPIQFKYDPKTMCETYKKDHG